MKNQFVLHTPTSSLMIVKSGNYTMFGIFSLEIFTGTTETFQIFAAHGLPLQTSEKERRKMELINNLVDYSTRYPVHLKCQSLECQW